MNNVKTYSNRKLIPIIISSFLYDDISHSACILTLERVSWVVRQLAGIQQSLVTTLIQLHVVVSSSLPAQPWHCFFCFIAVQIPSQNVMIREIEARRAPRHWQNNHTRKKKSIVIDDDRHESFDCENITAGKRATFLLAIQLSSFDTHAKAFVDAFSIICFFCWCCANTAAAWPFAFSPISTTTQRFAVMATPKERTQRPKTRKFKLSFCAAWVTTLLCPQQYWAFVPRQ